MYKKWLSQRSLACLWPSRSCTVNYPPQGSSQYPRLWSFLVRLQPLGEFRVVAPGGQAGGDFQQLPLPFGVRSLVVTRPRCVRLRCHEPRAPQAGVPNSWAKPECASPPCGVPPHVQFFPLCKGGNYGQFSPAFSPFLACRRASWEHVMDPSMIASPAMLDQICGSAPSQGRPA